MEDRRDRRTFARRARAGALQSHKAFSAFSQREPRNAARSAAIAQAAGIACLIAFALPRTLFVQLGFQCGDGSRTRSRQAADLQGRRRVGKPRRVDDALVLIWRCSASLVAASAAICRCARARGRAGLVAGAF